MGLTESLAMTPAASVSGFYIWATPTRHLLQRRQDRRRPLWIRFVARVADRDARWLLEVDLPGVDDASFYYRNAAGALVVQHAGDSLAQSQWAERGRMPFFSLGPDTGREVTYLVRISHARVPFSGGLFLKTQVVASDQEQRAQFLLGAYFGLAALAVFVALANALVYRDRGFGAYAIYVLAMILGQAGITGVGGMLFWPEMPALNNPMTFFMPLLAGALGVWFVRIVATPQQYSTLLDRLAVSIILGLIAVAGIDAVVPSVIGFELSLYLLALSMGVVLLLLGLAIARGDRHSRWIAAGYALIVLGGIFPVARNFGLIQSGFLSEYGLMLGSAMEMPLLFYGLNRRLNEQTETRARARALAVTDPLTGLTSPPVLHGLGHMGHLRAGGARQVGNGARHLQGAVRAAGRPAQAAGGGLQELRGSRVQGGVGVDAPGPAAPGWTCPGAPARGRARATRSRTVALASPAGASSSSLGGQGGHLHMQVDAVEQRPAELALVARHLVGRAAAGALRRPKKPQGQGFMAAIS
jgi:hypothetical protein